MEEKGKLLYQEPLNKVKEDKAGWLLIIIIFNCIFIWLFITIPFYFLEIKGILYDTGKHLITTVHGYGIFGVWLLMNILFYLPCYCRFRFRIYENGISPLERFNKKSEFTHYNEITSIKLNPSDNHIQIFAKNRKGAYISKKSLGNDEYKKAKQIFLNSYEKWQKKN